MPRCSDGQFLSLALLLLLTLSRETETVQSFIPPQSITTRSRITLHRGHRAEIRTMLELLTTGGDVDEHDRATEEESALFQYSSGEPHFRRPVSPGCISPTGILPPGRRPEDESRSGVSISDDAPPQWISLHDDVDWSILSNAFFVAGGLIYVIGSTWDYAMYSAAANPEDLDLHSVLRIHEYVIYQAVWIMGPVVYFLNSVIDVKWALIAKERDVRRRHLEKLLVEMPETPLGKRSGRARIKAALRRPKMLLKRMRRHIGHRRQLGAATTFGLGAFLGIIAAVCSLLATDTSLGQGDYLSDWAATLESSSVHMYLVSAIFALWRSPSANVYSGSSQAGVPWYSNVEYLETLGDVFFGLASFIDVVLQDSTVDDGILWLPIISAVLWTVDALLYLKGDFASLYKEIHSIDFGEGIL